MKILIVTVAGMSTRFSRSLGRESLKCIYFENTFSDSLLYRLLSQPIIFDKYIIVGGYKFEELKNVVEYEFKDYIEKIILINNQHFFDCGSGYSLFLGIKEALKFKPDEIVFSEGDLYIDKESFIAICNSKYSIITYNREPILADKAVAFYFDQHNIIHYIYDTGHQNLAVKEPFLSIYNSGQIWKFNDFSLLKVTLESLLEDECKGTNLVIIEEYFRRIDKKKYRLLMIDKWINCNTIFDFKRIQEEDHENH